MNTGANGFMSIKLDNETKIYLEELQNIHNTHKDKFKNKQVNFGDLIIDLGNFYVSKKIEISEKYSGEELTQKLSKLSIAFTIYTEEKVIGDIKEVGTMANEIHFTLAVAKSERYIKEAIEAVKNGKSAKSAVKRDITHNDKEFVSGVVSNAKVVLSLMSKYLDETMVQALTDEEVFKLNEYTIEKVENGEWSFNKLFATFELLDKIKGAKEDRYSKDEFSTGIESDEFSSLYTQDEKDIFVELYRIYN